jgi:glycosyltransferase involved in cell wall biosynthesis
MSARVSILIPCYNAERWIAQAIQSALDQTYPHKEVIVIDDGSTDGSLQIIREFGERIRWETGPNRGGNIARNQLLQLSRGDWLQYLDADDYLLPEKIAEQIEFLKAHRDVDVIYSPFTIEHWSATGIRKELSAIPEPRDPWELLCRAYLPQTGSPLWRKQAILDVGGWKSDQPCCQEYELYLRLLMAGKQFKYCPQTGSVHRRWSNQTVYSRDIRESQRRRLDVLRSAAKYLEERGELTARRMRAVNEHRFLIARSAWLYDSRVADEILREIRSLQPKFFPNSESSRWIYRIIYLLLGFHAAQCVSNWRYKLSTRRS